MGHVHNVAEKIAGVPQTLQLEFLRPSKFFDISQFEAAGVTACIVARIHAQDSAFGAIALGYMVGSYMQHDISFSIVFSEY